ncbi:hypothetical protein [Streptomyces sp. KR80]|uniref:hypothetical protein n=1 Tax=Streptomyces sp. KR80 TaxID=3457426 RepID=UPI003FD10EAB
MFQLLFQIVNQDVSVEELDVSPELRELLRKATARSPSDRPQVPDDFLSDLAGTPEAHAEVGLEAVAPPLDAKIPSPWAQSAPPPPPPAPASSSARLAPAADLPSASDPASDPDLDPDPASEDSFPVPPPQPPVPSDGGEATT